MKVALIVYHKNADIIYAKEWIAQFSDSILNQTFKKFDIYEINYGGKSKRIFENSIFYQKQMPSFVDAMNFLIEKCITSGYQYIFNSNCDDYYSHSWINTQLHYLTMGFDVVSSNFSLVENNNVVLKHDFSGLSISKELSRNNNIIAHPSVSFNSRFFKANTYLPNEVPMEDLLLWKRAIAKGNSFFITKENLLYHRIHNNSVCKSENR